MTNQKANCDQKLVRRVITLWDWPAKARSRANLASRCDPSGGAKLCYRTRMVDDALDAGHWDAVEEATELLHEERYHEALENLRDVIKQDNKNPYAFYFLGVALFEVGELPGARDAYRACLTRAPEHLGARVAMCHVMRSLGELRDALREGMTALSQVPGDGDALHAVGLVYHARGDLVAARRYLDAFLASGPEYEVGHEVQMLLATFNDQPRTPELEPS